MAKVDLIEGDDGMVRPIDYKRGTPPDIPGPLVAESVVINLINNGEVASTDFIVRAGGVALTPNGRKSVLAAYERRLDTEITHPTFGYRVSYRRTFEVQARLLGTPSGRGPRVCSVPHEVKGVP